METLIILVYAAYIIAVGIRGNSTKLLGLVTQEGQFVSWLLIIAFVSVLGDFFKRGVGWLFLVLILLAFLLSKKNSQFFSNLSKTYQHFTLNTSSAPGGAN